MAIEIPPIPAKLVALGRTVTLWFQEVATRFGSPATPVQQGIVFQAVAENDSTAVTVAGIVADHNSLLAKLRAAGILES